MAIITIATMICIDFVYMNYIVPVNAYLMLGDSPIHMGRLVSNIFIVIVFAIILPKKINKPSSYALWYFYFSLLVPLPFIIERLDRFSQSSSISLYYWIISFSIMVLIVNINIGIDKYIKLIYYRKLYITVICITLLILVFGARYIDTNVFINLNDVYDRRFNARLTSHSVPIIGYLIAFLSGCSIPYFMAKGFDKNRYIFILLSIICSIYIFAFNGTKSSLVLPFLLIFVSVLEKLRRHNRLNSIVFLFMLSLSGFVFMSIIEKLTLGSDVVSNMFVRRILIVPSQASVFYMDFFENNRFTFMTDSVMKFLFDRVYDLPTPFLLGEHFFGRPDMAFNAGIWASAFAQFGLVGSIAVSIIAGILFRYIDIVSSKIGYSYLPYTSAIFLAYIWSEQALHTSILSSGVIFLLIINSVQDEKFSITE